MTREGAAFIAEAEALAPELERLGAKAKRLVDESCAAPEEITTLWAIYTLLSKARRTIARGRNVHDG